MAKKQENTSKAEPMTYERVEMENARLVILAEQENDGAEPAAKTTTTGKDK